jgi:parallel beta-helix repeat protein
MGIPDADSFGNMVNRGGKEGRNMTTRIATGLFILIMALILIFTPAGPQVSGQPGSEIGYTPLLQQLEGEPTGEPQPPPEEEPVVPEEEPLIPEEGLTAMDEPVEPPETGSPPETVPGDNLSPDALSSPEEETAPPGDTLPPDTVPPDEDLFPPGDTYPPEDTTPVEPVPPETSEEPTVPPDEPTGTPDEPTGIPPETATTPPETITPEPSDSVPPVPSETVTPLPTETITPVPAYPLNIHIEGEGQVIREPEVETYPEGTEVLMTAVPAEGWLFNLWSGDLEGMEKQQKLVVTGEMEVTAVFIRVTTLSAAVISADSAVLYGELSLFPAEAPVVSFEYGETASLGKEILVEEPEVEGQSLVEILQGQPETFFAVLSDLTPGTLYYYRAKVVLGDQTAYGEILTFTTLKLTDGPRSDWFVSPQGNDATGDGSKARPFRTISRALEAASDGHRVCIYPGIYPENLLVNKSVDILGESGKATDVVIDGSRKPNGNVIEMTNIKCSIKNLTVANGARCGIYGDKGGHFEFQNLIVKGNFWGISYYFPNNNSAITVRDCRFHSNNTGISIGGHPYPATIQQNVLENNSRFGIHLADAQRVNITGNIIKRNGYGIFSDNSNLTVTGNTIENNSSEGVAVDHSSTTITRNVIRGNGSHGISLQATLGDITNNLIVNNKKNGIHGEEPNTIANNTITGNNGGLILPYTTGRCRIINNIIVWNGEDFSCKTRASYCNIGTGDLSGSRNISADPLFVNPAKGDYHLRTGSPCIDTGTGSGAPGIDLDGNKRPYGRGVDMGCYESRAGKSAQPPATSPPAPPVTVPPKPAPRVEIHDWWVSLAGSDQTGDGTRENPFRTIRKAVSEVAAGDTVHVLPGLYQENLEITASLTLTGESEKAAEVVINGEKKGVVIRAGQVKLSLKKLTLENGEKYGLELVKSHCTLEDVIIKDNAGDGVYAEENTLTVQKCQVFHNSGAGILVKEAALTVTESHIHSNKTGLQVEACQALITGNVIEKCREAGINFREYRASIKKNTVRENGFGIVAGGSLDIENNLVVKNDKAGILIHHSPVKINNNTISGNDTGIEVDEEYRDYRFYNNISWGNAGADVSGPVGSTHSNIRSGNTSGNGNLRDDPQFVNPEQGDYQLKSGSSCIDAATNKGAPAEDLAGNQRPADGDQDGQAVTDMGAYEHIP